MSDIRIRGLIIFASVIFISVPCFTQSVTLDQALEQSLENNPVLIAAKQKYKAEKAAWWESVSPANPHLFAEWEGIPESSSSIGDYGERKIGIKQEIELPLNYYLRARWQSFQKSQQHAEYLSAKNDIVAQVKKTFFRIVSLKKQIKLHNKMYELTAEILEKARVRVKAGESSPYDSLKVKVDLAEVDNHLHLLTHKYNIARSKLKVLMGENIDKKIEFSGDLVFSPVAFSLDSLFEIAQESHPNLSMSKDALRQKKTEHVLAWSGLLPRFEIRYFRINNKIHPDDEFQGGEIGLSLPLFFFMKNQGRIRKTHYQVQASKSDFNDIQQNVLLGIKATYSKLTVAEKRVQNYRENTLKEVEELVRIATRSYEEGEMGYIEVAEALRSMNRTQVGYIDALYEFLAAQADLEQATGCELF